MPGRDVSYRSEGFSLLELLVVVAMIAALVAVLLPALTGARRQARTVACQGILKAWSLAGQTYACSNRDRLVNDGNDFGGAPDINQRMDGKVQRWRSYWINTLPQALALTPYYRLAESGHIPMPDNSIEPYYMCPEDSTRTGTYDGVGGPVGTVPYRTSNKLPFYFNLMYNNNSTGNHNEPPVLADVRWPQNSVLFSERRCSADWDELPAVHKVLAQARDAAYSDSIRKGYAFQTLNTYRGGWTRVTGRHNCGSNVAFMDGSARWVPFGVLQLTNPQTGKRDNRRLIWDVVTD